jgi:hypothetical protein
MTVSPGSAVLALSKYAKTDPIEEGKEKVYGC